MLGDLGRTLALLGLLVLAVVEAGSCHRSPREHQMDRTLGWTRRAVLAIMMVAAVGGSST
jgi:hypothetical protein